ncbi:MAG TPA: hypothetical protein VK206_07465 [Anaerolineales bacterium]|nr:hypothetical protein [Anaerolineales bacterium]
MAPKKLQGKAIFPLIVSEGKKIAAFGRARVVDQQIEPAKFFNG